ncbi:hypothetical protein CNY89_04770 [Amaricoccus sp. HAR-UPW-R2A-40]|nr:hypothetical protein CNY89_04770 [Amaricoccus sp. HAR-UPW-R2A-40]
MAETVGRLQGVLRRHLRHLDLKRLTRGDGDPFRLRAEFELDDRLGARRDPGGFVLRFGIVPLRDLAVLADHVSAAVVFFGPPGRPGCLPALTVARVETLAAPPDEAQVRGWSEVAQSVSEPFRREEVRRYLVEAALDFLVAHETAHARLGHLDALPSLLLGAVLDEGEQARRFDFSEAARGLEYAADIAGFLASVGEIEHADLHGDLSDRLWAEGSLRLSLRLTACYLVLLLFHLRGAQDAAHPAPLARLLAVAQIPLSAPAAVPEPLAGEGAGASILNAFKILLQAARRLAPLQRLRDLGPGPILDRMAEERRLAAAAMRSTFPLMEGRDYK